MILVFYLELFFKSSAIIYFEFLGYLVFIFEYNDK